MRYKNILVIFDLDGTLYKTETSFVPAVREFLRTHQKQLHQSENLMKLIGEPTWVLVEWLKSLNIDQPLNLLRQEFDRLELDSVRQYGELYDATRTVLEHLSLAGSTLGICTNGRRPYIDTILNKFDIKRHFSLVRYPQDREDTKNIMLSRIKSEFSTMKAFMIGDRFHDIEAAKVNGFVAVGAGYGYGGEEVNDADYIIDDLAQLVDIIEENC